MLPVVMKNFVLHLRGERLSEKTIRQYEINLRDFVSGVFNGREPELDEYDNLTTTEFMKWLKEIGEEKDLSASSLNQRIATLRKFYTYLMGMKVVTVNTPSMIGTIKSDTLFSRVVLTKKEVVSLTAKARKISEESNYSYTAHRNEMIVNLFIGTGLRIEELHKINVSDINIETGQFTVVGKRGKVRTVFLPSSKLPLLQGYLKLRGLQKSRFDDALFLSRQSKKGSYRLSIDQIRNVVVDLAQKAQVKPITPHSLRHTHATISIQSGVDIIDVSKNLGHSTISITEKIYIHQTNESARRVAEAMNDIF